MRRAGSTSLVDKTTITRLLRTSWETVAGIVERVVAEHVDTRRLTGLLRIGVDEVSYRKGHRYLRHTNAMLLRASGVDIATIALWLGHETTQTTRIYEHADPRLKEQAIARTAPLGTKPGRYRPSDALLTFRENL